MAARNLVVPEQDLLGQLCNLPYGETRRGNLRAPTSERAAPGPRRVPILGSQPNGADPQRSAIHLFGGAVSDFEFIPEESH